MVVVGIVVMVFVLCMLTEVVPPSIFAVVFPVVLLGWVIDTLGRRLDLISDRIGDLHRMQGLWMQRQYPVDTPAASVPVELSVDSVLVEQEGLQVTQPVQEPEAQPDEWEWLNKVEQTSTRNVTVRGDKPQMTTLGVALRAGLILAIAVVFLSVLIIAMQL